jgi:hypothetical protein
MLSPLFYDDVCISVRDDDPISLPILLLTRFRDAAILLPRERITGNSAPQSARFKPIGVSKEAA